MFLKQLRIESEDGLIRDLNFHQGLNLIVDETPDSNTETGNNVGKTTVLRLIDICLGKEARTIYVSPEDNRTVNEQVKRFLVEKKVVVTLTLVSDWTDQAREVRIRRNFLNYGKAIREINGETVSDKEYVTVLQQVIMGEVTDKPSFRQLIGHNIRYSNVAVNQTLRYLEGTNSDTVYEALYLYMLGCDYKNADLRQETMDKLTTESRFKNRLEKEKTKNILVTELGIIKSEIEELENQKSQLHLNPDFEKDMQQLTDLKVDITTLSAQISSLKLRHSILTEAQQELLNQKSDVDLESLRQIYAQANRYIGNLHHSFVELVAHHNNMMDKKAEFVGNELPGLEQQIGHLESELAELRMMEQNFSDKLLQSSSYADYEMLISELTQKHEKLGSLEQQVKQIEEVDEEMAKLQSILDDIDKDLFAGAFQEKVQGQLDKFNKFFARISQQLYGEKYAMTYSVVTNRTTGKEVYKFSIIPIDSGTVNFSAGKKQGEITCFDMAYILFADQEGIPCLHFGLYDKKELMHDHQLIETAKFVGSHLNLQFVMSILQDKLPESLNDNKYIVVKLRPDDKLFRF